MIFNLQLQYLTRFATSRRVHSSRTLKLEVEYLQMKSEVYKRHTAAYIGAVLGTLKCYRRFRLARLETEGRLRQRALRFDTMTPTDVSLHHP